MRATRISLSPEARILWAKTDMSNDEQRGYWLPLYVHMVDSANTAQYLWRDWLPTSEKRVIASAVGGDEAIAEALLVWLAGIHDIGKATPNFQCKVPERAESVLTAGLVLPSPYRMGSKNESHAFMGEAVLDIWLKNRGWNFPSTYSCIVGGHHGMPPSSDDAIDELSNASIPSEVLGNDSWKFAQTELLNWMFDFSGLSRYEDNLKENGLLQPAEVLLTALVIMADWIASNIDFFPLTNGYESADNLKLRADEAWEKLRLPKAWNGLCSLCNSPDAFNQFFHERFMGFPKHAYLRPAQMAALEAAEQMEEPSLLIIEAPMGNGKTEASLLCAEVLAGKFGSGGVAYLLPTMATSNAMFARVKDWLDTVIATFDAPTQSMQLLHSKAALNLDFSQLKTWHSSSMGDVYEHIILDGEGVIAHQWFGGRKRGLLASFVVGTVDQLLMAALKTKHVQLRHLGLAGKVVIIDEVHAYDTYMSTYLNRVLSWLGAYGVPVILLSATLPPARRKALMKAYCGRDNNRTRRSHQLEIPGAPRLSNGKPAYPVISALSRNSSVSPLFKPCTIKEDGMNVAVEFVSDSDSALVAKLSSLLVNGGCACILRDTVKRAQTTYRMLQEHLDDTLHGTELKLVHSRFVAADRLKNDAELLDLLGKDRTKRPEKLIVVGTQVMEQSLDIDFDVMFSDIAPIDLLLQRMGRLHRHEHGEKSKDRPAQLRTARCFITGVNDWKDSPLTFAKGVDSVYPQALLMRTIIALRGMEDAKSRINVNLPHDIASLVECVYAIESDSSEELNIPSEWMSQYYDEEVKLKKKQDKSAARAHTWLIDNPKIKRPMNLIGWLNESLSITDEAVGRATVRDSQESMEVIMVQEQKGKYYVLPWIDSTVYSDRESQSLGDGEEIPDDEVARLAATCTVSLPPQLTYPNIVKDVMYALEKTWPVRGWQQSRWLNVPRTRGDDPNQAKNIAQNGPGSPPTRG
ncbi:CRISPR-associated helicase Cas3' [Atopobium sp.]|uniref:CRISPR-associated helicase Cas3' n=1 Tax=Atopobium sp. TaxID=1872650 RepID=UPI0039C17896